MDLPKKYDEKEAEPRWRKYWETEQIYKFDPNSNKPIFSVDTPPPTVSGKMHLGHALAYSQLDFVLRYKRMRGHNLFYPFGFDDNGLATERFVEKKSGKRAKDMSRSEFVKLCLKETEETERELKENWNSLGISPDWNLNYRTIDDHCRKTSQTSFLKLNEINRVYRKESPIMICPKCQTAIAQVELKDKKKDSFLYHIKAKAESGEELIFATTRPELLPACMGISVNPKDDRYKHLIGKKAKLPITNVDVKISGDEIVDPEYGSGIVYFCSYGGVEDIEWLTRHPEAEPVHIMGIDGKYNEKAGKYQGMDSAQARKEIIEDLKKENALIKEQPITHTVNTHERDDVEIEFVATTQWFIKYLDMKDRFLKAGNDLNWTPKFMKHRYDNWVKGLKWDWCISRQRYFGVPFPVWYCTNCEEKIFAKEEQLPVDPLEDTPPVDKCPNCGSTEFVGEKDIMDTWATSSLTPQIATKWVSDKSFFDKLFPMSLRPNGHDIITFWLFNTVVKSVLHENKNPWKDVMVNGFVLDPHGRKMSKSKGNVVEPQKVLEKYSSDSLRFWAASAKLGDDLPYQEKELVTGKKTVNKLWNASKFVLMNIGEKDIKKGNLGLMDTWLLTKLYKLVKDCTNSFEEYDFSHTKMYTDNFFWNTYCSEYLELIKDRIYNPDNYSQEEVDSVVYTLHESLLIILKLFAPIMPHITDEIYHLYYAQKDSLKSIHISEWPKVDETILNDEIEKIGDLAIDIISNIRQFKSNNNVALNKPVKKVIIHAFDSKADIEKVLKDIKAVTKAEEITFEETDKIQVKENLFLDIIL